MLVKLVDLFKPRKPDDMIEKIKDVSQNFHIYTFGGLNETNKWLLEKNYA